MNAVTTQVTPIRKSVLLDMATRYGMEPEAFEATVRATCMKPDFKTGKVPTREEFAAFLLVAKEYNLNPLTKEIYAFPAKGGGIVPIVSLDGWVNLINSHGACDGFEFDIAHSEDGKLFSCTCRIYRKDRSRPVTVTEYFSECYRATEPWKMEHRMLRHKALIQAARYAFGFSGIYDEDEAVKIAGAMTDITHAEPRPAPPRPPEEPEAAPAQITAPEAPEIEDAIVEDVTDEGEELDPNVFFTALEEELAVCQTVEDAEEAWVSRDPLAVFDGDDVNIAIANAIKNRRLKAIGASNGKR